jgi:hypothetical protein
MLVKKLVTLESANDTVVARVDGDTWLSVLKVLCVALLYGGPTKVEGTGVGRIHEYVSLPTIAVVEPPSEVEVTSRAVSVVNLNPDWAA